MTTSDQVRDAYRRMAKLYDGQARVADRLLFGHAREWVAAHATGDVLEIGVGTGLNLPHYGKSIRLVGIDLSGDMLAVARKRVATLALDDRVNLRQADAQHLDLADSTFDTVVSTCTFCTIPDPAAAAREAFRLLRPGGRLVLVEHGPSSTRWMAASQRTVERMTLRICADHLTRDPVIYLRPAGFAVDSVLRSRAGMVFRVLATRPSTQRAV